MPIPDGSPSNDRPSLDEYFMRMAKLAAKRSTCTRRSVGALIVKNKRVLATGYNGPPKGITHCEVVGCIRTQLGIPSGKRHELCRGLHAEQNAIIQASVFGVDVSGSTMYVTNKPCIFCAKMALNAGIKEIVFESDYNDAVTDELIRESDLVFRRLKV